MTEWNKPKKAIKKLLVNLGWISATISIVAASVIIIWIFFPKIIVKFDKAIPYFYGNSIKSSYKQAVREKDKEEKKKLYKQLYVKLSDISPMERFYAYKQKATEYLTDYYLKNGDILKAVDISERWMKSYPNDFNAKFNHIKVLNITNKDLALNNFKSLYLKYSMINEVTRNYIIFLLSRGMVSEALKVEDLYNKLSKKNKLSFMIYYIDGIQKSFNPKQIDRPEYIETKKDNVINYVIKYTKKFRALKGLRLDIDSANIGTKLSNIKVTLKNNGTLYKNLVLIPIHSLRKQDDSLIVTGSDPHARIKLPEDILNKAGTYDLEISVDILNNARYAEEYLIQSKEWKVFYDTGKGFNESEMDSVNLNYNGNSFVSKLNVNRDNVQAIRLDFISLKQLLVSDLSLLVNNYNLTLNEVSKMHGFKKIDKGLEVIKYDPYLVFIVDNVIDIKFVDIKIYLDKDKQ